MIWIIQSWTDAELRRFLGLDRRQTFRDIKIAWDDERGRWLLTAEVEG